MKKSLYIFPIAISTMLLLAGCDLFKPAENKTGEVSKTTTEQTTDVVKPEDIKVEEKTDGKLAPFFQTEEIAYLPEAVSLDTDKVLANYQKAILAAKDEANKWNPEIKASTWADASSYFKFYEVGTINKAPYQSWKLVNLLYECEGPCMSRPLYRFAYDEKDQKLVMLIKNSYSSEYGDQSDIEVLKKNADQTFLLPGFTLPKTILTPDGLNSVELKGTDVDMATPDNLKKEGGNPYSYLYNSLGAVAFTDAKVGEIYFSGMETIGCLFLKLPDGTLSEYAYDPRLFETSHPQMIAWEDKKEPSNLTDDYSLVERGCGIGSACYFVENIKETELEKVGTTTDRMDIFIAKNPVFITDLEQNAVNFTEAQVALMYAFQDYENMWSYQEQTGQKKMTFEEFVANRPLIYFKDPFGRLVGLIRNDSKIPAECGKPVIYLYPEKTTDVSVKVGIKEFTKTVPDYGNGWVVKAEPNGQLINYADGQTYPYLFWEGKTDQQVGLTSGFVVAKADLPSFLEGSLSKLGLNTQEKADFVEFWLPKMQVSPKPYVLISFLGTTEFNKIAPLNISPKPETLIRVFMYYQPVDQQLNIQPQELKSLARNGFTVVEWGGTSSESWQLQ